MYGQTHHALAKMILPNDQTGDNDKPCTTPLAALTTSLRCIEFESGPNEQVPRAIAMPVCQLPRLDRR